MAEYENVGGYSIPIPPDRNPKWREQLRGRELTRAFEREVRERQDAAYNAKRERQQVLRARFDLSCLERLEEAWRAQRAVHSDLATRRLVQLNAVKQLEVQIAERRAKHKSSGYELPFDEADELERARQKLAPLEARYSESASRVQKLGKLIESLRKFLKAQGVELEASR